jgi:nanoRNase/pAp phosphatase (c-di-AMP/oligoRNAs hydrolase)
MENAEQQVIERLKQARNILVTVRNNPNVDLLSSCIGLALGLDKMEKHVAAVFSGEVPSTLEFLKPEETIEQNPDSLRDFIIALDKSKADKLRYKVEDKVVRIFITPYKTSLSQEDLEFSQGDFNVDAVIALGAHEQQELDQAITTHGRILHDATVICINNTANGNLGSINWQDTSASSVSELVTMLLKDLDKSVLDEQIATALLTGIVAETARFSNEKTTPRTMSLAGDLMSAGANQQLVATQLEEGGDLKTAQPNTNPTDNQSSATPSPAGELPKPEDGTLEISHQLPEVPAQPGPASEVPDRDMLNIPEPPKISGVYSTSTNDNPFSAELEKENDDDTPTAGHDYLIDEPAVPGSIPSTSSRVQPSNANPFDLPPQEPTEPLMSQAGVSPTAQFGQPTELPEPPLPTSSPASPANNPFAPAAPYSPAAPLTSASDTETLEKIEQDVHSPHLNEEQVTAKTDVDNARQDVLQALQSSKEPLKPVDSLGASPLGSPLHADQDPTTALHHHEVEIDQDGNLTTKKITPPSELVPPEDDSNINGNPPLDMPLPPEVPGQPPMPPAAPNDSTPPPTVPPPFMPPHNF